MTPADHADSNHPNQLPQPDIATPTPVTASPQQRHLPSWRFWLPLLFQTGLILAVPAHDAYTYIAGRQITLQTAPVDPYDLLRGHYQTLGYQIGQAEHLRKLPGGEWFDQHAYKAGTFYLVLQAPAGQPDLSNANPPKPWQPVRVSAERPTNLAAEQVAIEGKTNGWGRITYGIETYYMPEANRNQLNADINNGQNRQAYLVDVKVDSSGNAVPVSLWIANRNYRF